VVMGCSSSIMVTAVVVGGVYRVTS